MTGHQAHDMKMTIWYIEWKNESGDSGIHGAWEIEPDPMQVRDFMLAHHKDDFYYSRFEMRVEEYITWTLKSMELQGRIDD